MQTQKKNETNGGQVTISPPSKVNNYQSPVEILASGIDSLNLAIDVHWSTKKLFRYLASLKDAARRAGEDVPGHLSVQNCPVNFPFLVKPHGVNGYEWIVYNKELTFKIGTWTKPQSRPSVLAEIRSETLWHHGAEMIVRIVEQLLRSQGGSNIVIKPSRVDLCVDALLPDALWNNQLIEYAITRSTSKANYLSHNKLTGVSIGRGKISARLYDKPLEIRQKSKKLWMYDIWGVDGISEDQKIIRTEFQLRRELLSQIAINDIQDLFSHCENIWAYCSQRWLKFQTNPEKHHTQRKTFEWWIAIQNGFNGIQSPTPIIRSKAIQADIDQNVIQAIGYVKSIISSRIAGLQLDAYVPAEIEDGLELILRRVNSSRVSQAEFSESVREKVAKYHRTHNRHMEAENERIKLGFPTKYQALKDGDRNEC